MKMSVTEQARLLYQKKLLNLGDVLSKEYEDILSPGFDDTYVDQFIHAQFTTGAEDYARRYNSQHYFGGLIDGALNRIELDKQQAFTILDVGSGSGNTIFPLLDEFPNSVVFASDLSKELLAILGQVLNKKGLKERVALLQLNAEELEFQNASLDIIVGGAILHHLFSPDKTIKSACKILKEGGYAMFFEPCQNGHILIRMAYDAILNHSRATELDKTTVRELQQRISFYDVRFAQDRDKSNPMFLRLEDKWMFSKSYFQELAKDSGFSLCMVYGPLRNKSLLEDKIKVHMRHSIGEESLPGWAWDKIKEMDASFTTDFKQENPTELAIVLRK